VRTLVGFVVYNPSGSKGGRLKWNENFTKVVCMGTFDEDRQIRIPCEVTYQGTDAPRWMPWFDEEPSEEQKLEMEQLEKEAKGEVDHDAQVDGDSDLGKLLKKAEDLKLDLSDSSAIKKTTAAVVEFLMKDGSLDIPGDEKSLKMTVGKTLISNKDLPASDVIKLLAKHFGFAEVKKEKAKIKGTAVSESCACSANGPLVAAIDELSSLYFKAGNSNGGISYKKVVGALKNIDFEITADNALGLGKGKKTKVAGIGAGSAAKIHEFLSTGTIEKLEELRAGEE